MTAMIPFTARERTVVLLVAAVQFVNILDFVIVMPMGPDFAAALGIPSSKLGMIGGSYTAAAAVSGLAGSFFLDRFDRRPALGVAMLGLVAGTGMGGMATGFGTLIAISAVFFLPPLRGHLALRADRATLAHLCVQRNVLLSWAMTFVVMMAGFIIIPNISAYVQFNLHYPRSRLGLLYLYGG